MLCEKPLYKPQQHRPQCRLHRTEGCSVTHSNEAAADSVELLQSVNTHTHAIICYHGPFSLLTCTLLYAVMLALTDSSLITAQHEQPLPLNVTTRAVKRLIF